MVKNGLLGEIHAVEASCLDPQDKNGTHSMKAHRTLRINEPTTLQVSTSHSPSNQVAYSSMLVFTSWVIPLRSPCSALNLPKVDVGRYFLDVEKNIPNPKKQVNRVIAFGQQAVYSELAEFGDADNAWGLVEFANGKILQARLSRTITNGFEASTRVCGTKGHSVINGNSTLNRVEIRDEYGVRTTSTPDAFALYDKTFINDIAEFAAAVLDDSPLSCSPDDAYEAGKIACALQHSFRLGEPVYFDESGQPLLKPLPSK